MTQPALTEIRHDGGEALTVWPTTDLPAAIALLERIPGDALARACAAIRGGREGREGPISWRPLPEVKGTIAGALWAARAALRERHVDAHMPIRVVTRHGAEWCSVNGLGDTALQAVGEECETLQHSAEERP